MPLPATICATKTPINPTVGLTGFLHELDIADAPSAWWEVAEDTNKRRGRAGNADGTVEYPTHWLKYDHALQTGRVRVFVPFTASSGTQTLRIYPPVAANSIYVDTDPNGRNACYPDTLGDYPGDDLTDVSGNNRTLMQESGGGVTNVAGLVDDAINMPTTGVYALNDMGEGGISGYPLTLMAWVNADDWSSYNHQTVMGMVTSTNAVIAPEFRIAARFDTAMWPEYTDGSSTIKNTSGGTLESATWTHWAAVLTASTLTTYKNGVQTDSDAHSLDAPSLRYLMLGSDYSGMQGLYDEAKFIAGERSAEWVAHYYAMTSDPGSFYSPWVTEGGAEPTAPSLSAQYDGAPLADGGEIDLGDEIVRSDTPGVITVTVTNDGDAEATSIVVTPSGDASDTGTGTLGSTLAAGASATVILAMDYSAGGAIAGGCSIASDDEDSPLDFTITGTVIWPSLSVTLGGTPLADGEATDLGEIEKDGGGSVTLVLGNSGDADLHVSAAAVTGDGTLGDDPAGTTIAPGQTATMAFDPDDSATGGIELAVEITSDDQESPFTHTFTGTVIATPAIATRTPADGASGVGDDTGIELVMSRTVKVGSGTAYLRQYSDDTIIDSALASTSTVNFANKAMVTLSGLSLSGVSGRVYITLPEGFLLDLATDTPSRAYTGKGDWDFVVGDAASPGPTRSRARVRGRAGRGA